MEKWKRPRSRGPRQTKFEVTPPSRPRPKIKRRPPPKQVSLFGEKTKEAKPLSGKRFDKNKIEPPTLAAGAALRDPGQSTLIPARRKKH